MKGGSMKKDDEMDVGRWVDDRLAARISEDSWEPNVLRGLAQFRERRGLNRSRGRSLLWVVAGTAAGCLPLVAFPVTRAFAQHCMSACVTESSRLRELFIGQVPGKDTRLGPPEARKAAPDFTLNDAAGVPVRLSEFRGKVVLLNFWATWCTPCKTEAPWFTEFQKAYGDRGLVVLGVSLDDDGWKAVKPYIDEMKIDYRVMVADKTIAPLYGGLESIPVTLIIDKAGRIAVTHVGLCPRNEYEAAIDSLLAE
jgi:cytochrome c biogenesis protein CcmG/thiol:disulfide interchange protein DsbE